MQARQSQGSAEGMGTSHEPRFFTLENFVPLGSDAQVSFHRAEASSSTRGDQQPEGAVPPAPRAGHPRRHWMKLIYKLRSLSDAADQIHAVRLKLSFTLHIAVIFFAASSVKAHQAKGGRPDY